MEVDGARIVASVVSAVGFLAGGNGSFVSQGEDLTDFLDFDVSIQRVSVDFPVWMIQELVGNPKD